MVKIGWVKSRVIIMFVDFVTGMASRGRVVECQVVEEDSLIRSCRDPRAVIILPGCGGVQDAKSMACHAGDEDIDIGVHDLRPGWSVSAVCGRRSYKPQFLP